MPEMHSTGRGGAGNMGRDDVVYVDGKIVREGEPSAQGEHSTGRGGAGNFEGSPAVSAAGPRTDDDVIPEPAMHATHQENYHTGRGGQGNVHKDKYAGHSKPQSAEHMAAVHGQTPEQAEQSASEQQKEHHGIGDKVKALFEKKN